MDNAQSPPKQNGEAATTLTDDMATITAWRMRHPGVDYDKEPEPIGALRLKAMQRLSALSVGDKDPWLNRNIRVIIRKSTRFIVYLDEQCEVQWWWLQRPKETMTASLVQARATQLSHDST